MPPPKPPAPPSSDARRKRFDEDAPTQVDQLAPAVPRASTAPASSASGGSGGDSSRGSGTSSLVTARETLGYQEIQRTRAFMRVALLLLKNDDAYKLTLEQARAAFRASRRS